MVTSSNCFDVDRERVFRDIGYAANSEPSARMVTLVSEYVENAYSVIAPAYSYVIRDVKSVQGSRAYIEGDVAFESEVIARLLARAEEAAIFTLTIGGYLEETVAQLAGDGLILQAAVLDAVGSGTAEKLADFVQAQIAEVAQAEGLAISRRFSPGYCDWNVSQQKIVFQAMGSDSAGVRLTDGCLMIPRKSISGIIGIGQPGIESYNPCVLCEKQDCLGRR